MPVELMRQLAKYFARRTWLRDAAVDIEDLEQIAMLAMVKAWPHFDETRGTAKTYLGTAAKHDLWHYAEQLKRRPSAMSKSLLREPPDSDASDVDELLDLSIAVARHNKRRQYIMSLVVSGYSGEEIGSMLGISRERVRQILDSIKSTNDKQRTFAWA